MHHITEAPSFKFSAPRAVRTSLSVLFAIRQASTLAPLIKFPESVQERFAERAEEHQSCTWRSACAHAPHVMVAVQIWLQHSLTIFSRRLSSVCSSIGKLTRDGICKGSSPSGQAILRRRANVEASLQKEMLLRTPEALALWFLVDQSSE